ncbi:pyrroline-5-carboxylate reductase [Francisella frigiditurris]|uniref:Pyrroline-5-carboxylate reductase n=1 Tax=Francisella frigiditurris TaxID=1542390 RepID=A0A1J0KTZ6_9GAMM|nr:pyrroline-5-carboxylate reductase [Francisella frigiditurris]APC97151.1 pyrroline-5-carboxylate reductase [Francisella frigiditurris]
MDFKVCFVGGGNMAGSMISGLVEDGFYPSNITVFDRNLDKLKKLAEVYGVSFSQNLKEMVSNNHVVVLAVKPQQMEDVVSQIKEVVRENSNFIITVAAGISSSVYKSLFGFDVSLARVMPNTPASIRCGASGIFLNPNVSDREKEIVEYMMRTMGVIIIVDEEYKIDVVTACAGSAPAYFLLFMECVIDEARRMGLSSEQAKLLVTQTALGAAKMAMRSDDDIEVLRNKITSKGGTTAESLKIFDDGGIKDLVAKAMQANIRRSKELTEIFSSKLSN